MRGNLPKYEFAEAASLKDALSLMSREPGVWKPFAGGTDLMVVYEAGHLAHTRFFNLWQFGELRGIEVTDSHVTLGALTTYSQIQAHPVLRAEFPMLCQAAQVTGAIAIQNRGTVGGNIMNASPAADTPPALLVHEAEIELTSTRGSRWVPYLSFHTGYKKTIAAADELLTRVRVARQPRPLFHFYRKIGTRKAQAISKVCFAGLLSRVNGRLEARIALGSVAAVPYRCMKTEAVLNQHGLGAIAEAKDALAREIRPLDDIRSTSEYRLVVAQNLLQEFMRCGTGSAGSKS